MNTPQKNPDIHPAVEQLMKILEEDRLERAQKAEEADAPPTVYEAFGLEMGQERGPV